MPAIAANPPIPGKPLDPPPDAVPHLIRKAEDWDHAAAATVGVGFRAITRFNRARSALLAAGTTYYAFLATFSLIALAYGVTALLGADQIAEYLTEAISEAFPGLLGEDGIDPEELRSIGQAASIFGMIAMLYAGSGAMVAASSSVHLIYGAPPDPRGFVMKRIILLGWLLILGPLVAYSFVASSVTYGVSSQIMDAIGLEGSADRFLVSATGIALALAADFLVMYLVLGRLGGIRPPKRPLLVGSATGAVAVQILRIPMALVLSFSIDKPQYGALAIPIGVLIVLYFNSIAVYGAAALAAGCADRDVPLHEIIPTIELEETRTAVED
ncbi:MAG: YihY/virulence factor BrkB family protein [Actinomycetota bacterium]